jgi:osmotically-inducible protein OsmY
MPMTRAKPAIYVKSDAQIQDEVIQELKWDSRVEQTDVCVTVNHGLVALTGQVSSLARKMAAQEAAYRVPGVLDVTNDVKVVLPKYAERPDTELAEAVRSSLESSIWVDHRRIVSTVSNGWVTLEGTVDLLRERDDAERTISRLIGVRGLTNRIAVRGPKLSAISLRAMIEQALERRAERVAHRIHVAVNDEGAVTLTGRVRSWAEKRSILAAIRHAPGVTVVNENLFVDPLM